MNSNKRYNIILGKLLTISQVVDIINVHPVTIRNCSDSGLVKVCRLGYRREHRFKLEDIVDFINLSKS